MPQDLVPLFTLKLPGESELKEVRTAIIADGQSYKASSLIEEVSRKIEDNIQSIIRGEEMGELTVAAYILLESLHRAGIVSVADDLLEAPQQLFHSALCTAIGIRAGMQIPEDLKFETITSDSGSSVRDLATEEDEEPS